MPNMIWRSEPRPTDAAAEVVTYSKKSSASSGHAATHSASMVKLASRTHE